MADDIGDKTQKTRVTRAEQIKQIEARLARLKQAESKDARKKATKTKIILGAILAVMLKKDQGNLKKQIAEIVETFLKNTSDKELVRAYLFQSTVILPAGPTDSATGTGRQANEGETRREEISPERALDSL
jgi:hypothetical protein